MAKGGKGKKRTQKGFNDDGEPGSEVQEPLGDNLLGLGSMAGEGSVAGSGWAQSSATMIAAKQDRFSPSPGMEQHGDPYGAPEWHSPGPATAKGGGGGGWDLASSILHSGSSSSTSTPMKRGGGGPGSNDGSSIRSGNNPSKIRAQHMLSTVHEAPTVSTISRQTSNRTSLATPTAAAGFATFAALGRDNSIMINSPPPPDRRSRTSVEVKASSPAPSSFHPTNSIAYSNTGPVAMPALMMTAGGLQPTHTGGSHMQYGSPVNVQDTGGVVSPRRTGSERSFHTASVVAQSPGPGVVVHAASPTPDLGGGKTVATTLMQVSYSGGGPSTSVVGLVGPQSNGGLHVVVPPPGSTNGSRVVSVASSQRPISMKDARRVVSSPSIHSHHFAESSSQAPPPPQNPPPFVGMASSYHGHESVAGLSMHMSEKGKEREVAASEVRGAWTSTSGGGQGVSSGHAWDWEEDGASPSRAPSQIRTHDTGMSTGSQPYQPPLSAPPTSQPMFPAPPRPQVPRSMVMQRAMSETEYPPGPAPTHDARIQETGQLALKPAQRAFFGRHRHASERFVWNLGPEHDPRVEGVLEWVETMAWALANLGLSKFLAWRQRGALFANADFRPWKSPEEPGFDWMTFDEIQETLDKTLQESIATYDPATTALVFVFLVSKSGSSVAIWRRKVSIPPSLQLKHNTEIQRIKRALAESPKLVVKVERPISERGVAPISPPPPIVDKVAVVGGKKRKKRKWWQFWKSSGPVEDVVVVVPPGKENVRPQPATRGKLAKRR